MKDYITCLSASGQLGYGTPEKSFLKGLQKKPDYIGADMGSTDPGPHFLGSGNSACGDAGIRRDLELILAGAIELSVPLIIGSAGTAGARPHVDKVVDIVEDIVKKNDYKIKMAVIYSDIKKEKVIEMYAKGRIRPLSKGVPDITEDLINSSKYIVAQMGPEPFIEALSQKVDVIIAGRSCDASIFAAYPIMKGYNKGLAMHMAKIVECASQCADPGGRDAIVGYLYKDHFVIETMKENSRCTPIGCAAHSLYEQPNPYIVYEPGGYMNLHDSKYVSGDSITTRISGSKWFNENYTLKLESAKEIGFRAISLGAIRDPILIPQIDHVCEKVKHIVEDIMCGHKTEEDYRLKFRIYGYNGVMGNLEPDKEFMPKEIFVITDVVAKTQDLAKAVCGVAKQHLLHYFYPKILATGGNLAIPFAPDVIEVGKAYEFALYHLMEIDNPLDWCRIDYKNL